MPMDPEDDVNNEHEEVLELMIAAWRARDWLESHAADLDSSNPCHPCLGVTRAVLRGRQGPLIELACYDAQTARKRIAEAHARVKKLTGDHLV